MMNLKTLVILFCAIPLGAMAQSGTVVIDALVPGCGNAIVENGEACDGGNLAGQSCASLGFSSGSLSCSNSCTFNTASCVAALPSNNASGNSTRLRLPNTPILNIRGQTVPQSVVHILRNGTRIAQGESTTDGFFQIPVVVTIPGTYNYTVQVETLGGLRTAAYSFFYRTGSALANTFQNIVMSPSLDISQSVTVKGQPLDVYGESIPNAVIYIVAYQQNKTVAQATTTSNQLGKYQVSFATNDLTPGAYTVLAYSLKDGRLSAPSRVLAFSVGALVVPRFRDFDSCPFIRGDLNGDCKININDVLMAKSWRLSGVNYLTELERLSGDNKIDMQDFSIILYYWTG